MQLSEDDESYPQAKGAFGESTLENINKKAMNNKFQPQFKMDSIPLDVNFRDISDHHPKIQNGFQPIKTKAQNEENCGKPDIEHY